MKMKALVKTSQNPGIEFMDVDTPTIGQDDVLIKVKATAICGSDIHILHSSPGEMSVVNLPVIIGHETCGEVVETGERVTILKKGDKVTLEPHIPCGHCYYCQTGAPHNCKNLILFGFHINGAFAEYARVPENVCWKLPDDYSYDLGAILEPLGAAVHGALVEDISGKSVAIIGCGPIGQFVLGVTHSLGAAKVFALEVVAKRLNMAKQLAPDTVLINPKEQDPIEVILKQTDGLGVDVVIECSGNVEAVNQSLKLLKCEGRLSLIGMPTELAHLDLNRDIIRKEIRVHGSFGRLLWQTWWQVRSLLDTGKFNPLSVITHRFPLADYARAFKLAEQGEAGKILLYP